MELIRFSPSETLNIAAVVKACINTITNDYMVEDFAIYEFCGFREVFREFYIFFRRFRIAGWVIMHENQAVSLKSYCPLHRFFNVGGCGVQPADADFFPTNQPVFNIRVGDAEVFLRLMTEPLHEEAGNIFRVSEVFAVPLVICGIEAFSQLDSRTR